MKIDFNKNSLAIILGTLLEWAEFTFFAYMADHLSHIFFPVDNPDLARLKIYGVFAASYFMRPAGALFFGHIGDKYGRRLPMIASLWLMALATFAIGILPTYRSIGALSSCLLVILRMVQGFAVGGEFNGSIVILTEYNKRHPFLAGSWTSFASTAGMVVGSFMAAAVVFLSGRWSSVWRIPFLLSSLLAAVAIYLRRDMKETEDFCIAKQSNGLYKVPIVAAWRHNRAGLLYTAAVAMFVSVYVYTGNIYYRTIAVHVGGLAPEKAALAISVGIAFSMCLIPFLAMIADRGNGYKMCLVSIFSAILLSPVMIYLASKGSLTYAILGQLMYGAIDALTSSTVYTLLAWQFKTGTKYSGMSFAWSATTAIFGGTALMVNEYLVRQTGNAISCGIYMTFCAIICFVVVKKAPAS